MFQKVAVGTVVVIILGVIIAFIVTRDTTQVNCPTNAETVQDETNVTTNPEQDILKFIHVSDIHFDPLYDKSIADTATLCRPKHINGTNGTGAASSYEAPYGRIGCDTPLTLLESTLNAMKQNSEGSRFVLISGDLSAHKLSQRSKGSPKILQSIALVSNKAHQTFPDIPVFPVLGNNDLPENYKVPESNDWYKKVLANWAPLILCSNCTEGAVKPTTRTILEETFLDGGYYNASIADGKMVLLALNTMYWHINANYSNPVVSTTAVRQMMWLREQLDMAKTQGKKVFIMGHIHPGGDPFCPKDCYMYNFRFLWKANETKAFVNLVAAEYHDIVAGQFYSHIHKDDFNLQVVDSRKNGSSKSPAKSFALFVPSISVVFKNNPAFRVLSMDSQQLSLMDYNQYFLDLVTATEFSKPVWQFDYTFSKKYPSNNTFLNADRIYELNQQLINPHSNKYWQEYIFSRQVHYRPDDYSRFALYCIMRHVFEEDFKNCRDKYTVPGG